MKTPHQRWLARKFPLVCWTRTFVDFSACSEQRKTAVLKFVVCSKLYNYSPRFCDFRLVYLAVPTVSIKYLPRHTERLLRCVCIDPTRELGEVWIFDIVESHSRVTRRNRRTYSSVSWFHLNIYRRHYNISASFCYTCIIFEFRVDVTYEYSVIGTRIQNRMYLYLRKRNKWTILNFQNIFRALRVDILIVYRSIWYVREVERFCSYMPLDFQPVVLGRQMIQLSWLQIEWKMYSVHNALLKLVCSFKLSMPVAGDLHSSQITQLGI